MKAKAGVEVRAEAESGAKVEAGAEERIPLLLRIAFLIPILVKKGWDSS